MTAVRVRARVATIAIALLLAASSIPANASDPTVVIDPADYESASAWFVELSTAPTSEGTSAATVSASKDSFRNAAKSKRVNYAERFAYGDLWNGFSVSASAADINAIQRLPGVARVWPILIERIPGSGTDGGEAIDLSTAIAQTGADYVQDILGFTGKNIKVAVMDTGIDYDNPDLGGCFGRSCRVFTGWDFVGDAFNADSSSLAYSPIPVPDADPDDCNGHGTHVAGIVGANGDVKGVAPDVRFGAYRVFGCDGSTTTDVMLAAMERALADGMDVLNMSIGSAFQWPQYPTAVAADRLVRKHGIVVVASIGNNGASGLYSAGAPGVGEKVIGVAAFDNTTISSLTFNVSTSGRQVAYQVLATTQAPPTSGTSAEIVNVGRGCQADAAANPPIPATDPYLANPAGKVALVERGLCSFNNKYQRAVAAGAVGVIVYAASGAPGLFVGGSVVGADGVPGISISRAGGLHLISQSSPRANWTDVRVRAGNPTGDLISSFSSYGLAADLSLKPDIGAPGGPIFSTLPLEQGGHGNFSGTSMASPHVAGAVALLLQAVPKSVRGVDLEGVRDLLQNSADPHVWFGNPALGLLDSVQRQGAGMLDIRGAILARAAVTPGKLALGESQGGPATRTLTISDLKGAKGNKDDKSVTYTFAHQPALALGNTTFVPSFFTSAATVAFSVPSVSVKKNMSASVDVTITAPAGLQDRGTYGGYVVISGDDGSTYRVPYSGLKGDYQAIRVLPNGALRASARQTGYVSVGGAIASTFDANLTGYRFTMAPKPNPDGFGHPTFLDVPNYVVHLDHQSRSATFTVYDATGATAIGEAFAQEFLIRNSTSTSFFAFPWDGFAGPAGSQTMLPNGEYVMKLTVLKALGDASNPAHVETHTFAKVNIQRAP